MSRDNLSIILAERPTDAIIPNQTLKEQVTPAPTASEVQDGQVLLEILYLGLEPAMRGWMKDVRSYLPPVKIGEVMRAFSVSRVLVSKSPKLKEGEYTYAPTGFTEYRILDAKDCFAQADFPGLTRPQDMIGVLGITGLTAWAGMRTIGEPKPGELVVVSAGGGATGSVAGQIAKIAGATVVGTAGSDEKCRWMKEELGFDVALNYKASDFADKFKEATKDLIDVYFDNVGGETLDLALLQAKKGARFVECGLISQYNKKEMDGPKNFGRVVTMRIKMQGFIVLDFADRYYEARKELSGWINEGKLKSTETIIKGGLSASQEALVNLYKGINQGKLLVEIKNPDENPAKL